MSLVTEASIQRRWSVEIWWHKSTFKQWLHLPSLPVCQNLIKITPQTPLDSSDPVWLLRPHWTPPDPTELPRPHWTPLTTLGFPDPTGLDSPDHIGLPRLHWIPLTTLGSKDPIWLIGPHLTHLTQFDSVSYTSSQITQLKKQPPLHGQIQLHKTHAHPQTIKDQCMLNSQVVGSTLAVL